MREADARGNLAFDAQIAAVCAEHRVTALLTADRDFARFSRLKLPLALLQRHRLAETATRRPPRDTLCDLAALSPCSVGYA
ncbi:MAG: hypothetical protein ACREX9_18255 [Gammaproteobacteria bacterium]